MKFSQVGKKSEIKYQWNCLPIN